MKLFEFTNKSIKDDLPFDVVDDVHFHMIDDDAFYRKHYLPCMEKVKSDRNEDVIQGHIMPMIDKCLNHYCLKYDINKLPKDLMTKEEKSDLANKVLEYEKNPPKEEENAPKKSI